jgi:organic radical activating enzyme
MCDIDCEFCKNLKFCKKKYSSLYYKENKSEILEYQKQKYNKTKIEKHKITIKRGSFDPFINDR